MGGKDRMYVETDLPIIKIENDVINEGKKYSEFTADSIRNSLNISEEQLDQLISARKLDEAIKIHNEIGADFLTIIQIAVENWKYIKRKFGMEIKQEIIKDIIKNVNSQNITKEGALVVMEEMALKNVDNVEKIINDKKLVKVNEKRLEEEINKLIHNGKIDKINSLILNLKDRLGPTFEAKDAYRIATEKIKNEKK
jgi:glutamyl-tRNA(Gln) amidotransferase subunit E